MEDNNYYIQIEVLSPLYIGGGAENDLVKNFDYVVDEGSLYILDKRKIIQDFHNDGISSLWGKNQLAGKIQNLEKYSIRVVDNFEYFGRNPIKQFIKNGLSGLPFIPGSSLKGALRSVLFSKLKKHGQDNGKEVFGSSEAGNEFMRFISISDAEFINTEYIHSSILSLKGSNDTEWREGWKESNFDTIYESLMPNQVGFATLKLSPLRYSTMSKYYQSELNELKKEYQNRPNIDLKNRIDEVNQILSIINEPILDNGNSLTREHLLNDTSKLFKIINTKTLNHINKEKDFFNKYLSKNDIKQFETELTSKNNNSCILRMSSGSGFHSITGDWQFEDYINGELDRKYRKNDSENDSEKKRKFNKLLSTPGKLLPKSRKLAVTKAGRELMGFVKLTIVDKDTYEEGMSHLQQIKTSIYNTKLAYLEKERLAELKQLEQEQKRKEQALVIQQYNLLMDEATKLLNTNNFEEAKSIAEKAALMNPSGLKHSRVILICNARIEQILQASKPKEPKKVVTQSVQKFEVILKKYNPKDFKRLKDCIKKFKQQIVLEDDLNALSTIVSNIYTNTDAKWTNFDSDYWKYLSDNSNNEFTLRLFNSLKS